MTITVVIIIFIAPQVRATAEPEPTGGASCSSDVDCNGAGGNTCIFNNTDLTGYCNCTPYFAASDCSHKRYLKDQIVLYQLPAIIGVSGFGGIEIGSPFYGKIQLSISATFWGLLTGHAFFKKYEIEDEDEDRRVRRQFLCVYCIMLMWVFLWLSCGVFALQICSGTLADAAGYYPYEHSLMCGSPFESI